MFISAGFGVAPRQTPRTNERVGGPSEPESPARLEHGRIDDGPEMDEPAEEDEPEQGGKDKMGERHEDAPLD